MSDKIITYPGKWLFLIIILVSALPFLPLVAKMVQTPDGMSYGYYIDEHIYLAAIKSYSFGYLDPYGPIETSIFRTPFLASVYLFGFMGLLSRFLLIDAEFLLHFFTFLFSVIYFVAVYNLIRLFVKERSKVPFAFLFTLFASGGIGGALYVFLRSPIELIVPTAFQHVLWSAGLAPLSVIYFAGSLAFGYLAILYFIQATSRRHYLLPSIFLGIAALIYPLFGITFFGLLLVYALITRKIKGYVQILPLALLIVAPWAIFRSEYYSYYLGSASYTNPIVFLVHGFFILPLAFYYLYKNKGNKFEFLRNNKAELFLITWAIIIIVLAFAPQTLLRVPVQRFVYMAWLPLSLIAFLGIDKLLNSQRVRSISHMILPGIIAITLITFAFWYGGVFASEYPYFPEHEINALRFLKGEPQGLVLAGYDLSLRTPYFAEKRALRGGGPVFEQIPFIGPLQQDYEIFYGAGSTDEERKGVLNKYGVEYVIYSEQEREVSNGIFDPSGLEFLEIIYNSDTDVYRVIE